LEKCTVSIFRAEPGITLSANKSFENLAKFRHVGRMVKNPNCLRAD
jgi:hypothetical protein